MASVGTWRINDKIAISRAFGDRHLKRFVVPVPDIVVHNENVS